MFNVALVVFQPLNGSVCYQAVVSFSLATLMSLLYFEQQRNGRSCAKRVVIHFTDSQFNVPYQTDVNCFKYPIELKSYISCKISEDFFFIEITFLLKNGKYKNIVNRPYIVRTLRKSTFRTENVRTLKNNMLYSQRTMLSL